MPAFTIKPLGDDFILRNKYGVYSKRELEDQLKDGRLTVKELGDLYCLKSYQMFYLLKSLGISYRNTLGDTRVHNATISPSTHQVIIGTLLGDSYMKDDRSIHSSHGLNQVEYLYHIAERLHPFVASVGDKANKCASAKSFCLWTYRHEVFTDYFTRFYSHGKSKKYIIKETAKDLGPEGLAYWYMDDGKYEGYGYSLCVGNITQEEGEILRSNLQNNLGLITTFQVVDEPFIISSMKYKITGDTFPKVPFSKHVVVPLHKKLCETAGRFIRYFGDEVIKAEINNTCLVKNSKDVEIRQKIQKQSQISKTTIRCIPTEKELKHLFLQGMTDGKIAAMYGFGRNRVASLRRSMGLKRKACRLTSNQEATLKDMVRKRATIQDMMKETHLSFYKIKNWLK